MKTIAMIAAAVAVLSVTSIISPMPADAGWCIEACGLKRVPKQQSRETVCTTVRRGSSVETVCTSK